MSLCVHNRGDCLCGRPKVDRIDLVLQLAEMQMKLETAEKRVAELETEQETRRGPKPWCPDCNDPVGAHHAVLGCETKYPVYEHGRLSYHDVCGCKKSVRK
jgi:hypothetical protein